MKYSEAALLTLAIAAYFVLEGSAAPAEEAWRLGRSFHPATARFEIRRSSLFSTRVTVRTIPWKSIRGLAPGQAWGISEHVQFAVVRDAGAILCSGQVRFGTGYGTFTFKPDPDFVDELRRLGYSEPTLDQLQELAIHDVTREFARSVRDSGVQRPGYRFSATELVRLRQAGID